MEFLLPTGQRRSQISGEGKGFPISEWKMSTCLMEIEDVSMGRIRGVLERLMSDAHRLIVQGDVVVVAFLGTK